MQHRFAALLVAIAFIVSSQPVEARGFDWFIAHVHPTGKCAGAREVAASFYWSGTRTANGEHFDANGNTAASRGAQHGGYAIGSRLTITNPLNGRSINIRVNDSGPYGPAHRVGVKLDLAHGAARRLGMTQTQWVCVSGG